MGSTLWLGKLSISIGITGRGDNGDTPPWFGFYYGSWLPHASWNHGRPWRKEVFDIGWHWLCFHGAVTWWPGGGVWFWQLKEPKA